MSDDRLLYVAFDQKINYSHSGKYLRKLKDLNEFLLKGRKRSGDWTLVISIHGNIKYLSEKGGYLKNPKKRIDAGKIQAMFGDRAFTTWRDRFGPSRIMLNACQVGKPLENVIIKALTKKGSKQNATGLGLGCRPAMTGNTYAFTPIDSNGKPAAREVQINSWNRYNRYKDNNWFLNDFRKWLANQNRKYGYFGGLKIPANQQQHYYFNEEPVGEWATVVVSKNYKETEIPYLNRSHHPNFRRLCDAGDAKLRSRTPTAPPDPSAP